MSKSGYKPYRKPKPKPVAPVRVVPIPSAAPPPPKPPQPVVAKPAAPDLAERDARVMQATIDQVMPKVAQAVADQLVPQLAQRYAQAGAEAITAHYRETGALVPPGGRPARVQHVIRDERGNISTVVSEDVTLEEQP